LNGAARASFSFKKELRFDGVSFAYAEGKQAEDKLAGMKQAEEDRMESGNVSGGQMFGDHVLKGLSFVVPKGNTIGIIGKSGAGKTTVFDLILRLLKPTAGTITIDGEDINVTNLSQWRHRIAYVPQDAFLLNDTIRNNIRFHDSNVNDADIESAVEAAYLKDFVSELPEGLNTIVGERGTRLSGGQRQRIAIARALARKPEILLLDEATSALDVESEKYIQQAIEGLKGKMTIVIIAHRLSTVAHSDSLLVLDEGKIVESGKPADLLKDKETYYSRMYDIRN
jgi:ATP-binding cassette subfamily C protein